SARPITLIPAQARRSPRSRNAVTWAGQANRLTKASAVSATAAAVVDGERVTAAFDLDDLGDAGVALLTLVRRVGDCPWHGVVELAGDDEQRATVRVLAVDFRLRPGVEIGGGLEDGLARAWDGELAVEGLRLVL